MKRTFRSGASFLVLFLGLFIFVTDSFAATTQDILRQGLLGAGVGAISAGSSGGKAGRGALIGMGTTVIGGALFDMLSGQSQQPQQIVYAQPASYAPTYSYAQSYPAYSYQPAPQVVQRRVYYQEAPAYVQAPSYYQQPVYSYAQPQNNSSQTIIRQGLLGAGVGAISASASGGKAGRGALIGAGTNVIGGALLNLLTQS